jgi:hypothetical protein
VLSRPMGGRPLRPGSPGAAPAPIARPFPSDVAATPPPPNSPAGR